MSLYRTITIRQEYLEQIREQRKTVEGRIFKGIFTNLQQGNRIKFVATNNSHNYVYCKVISTKRYTNFREMLHGEGFQNCLPNASSLRKAIDVYNNIPRYRHQVAVYGAIAIRIEVIG